MFSCFKQSKTIIMDWELALSQCMNNEALLKQLLVRAYKDIETPLIDLNNNTIPFIKNYAHMVKGVCQNLAIREIEKNSIMLEKSVDKGDRKEIKKQIKDMKKNSKKLRSFLESKNIYISKDDESDSL